MELFYLTIYLYVIYNGLLSKIMLQSTIILMSSDYYSCHITFSLACEPLAVYVFKFRYKYSCHKRYTCGSIIASRSMPPKLTFFFKFYLYFFLFYLYIFFFVLFINFYFISLILFYLFVFILFFSFSFAFFVF